MRYGSFEVFYGAIGYSMMFLHRNVINLRRNKLALMTLAISLCPINLSYFSYVRHTLIWV